MKKYGEQNRTQRKFAELLEKTVRMPYVSREEEEEEETECPSS